MLIQPVQRERLSSFLESIRSCFAVSKLRLRVPIDEKPCECMANTKNKMQNTKAAIIFSYDQEKGSCRKQLDTFK
jgi:hypothetical protein